MEKGRLKPCLSLLHWLPLSFPWKWREPLSLSLFSDLDTNSHFCFPRLLSARHDYATIRKIAKQLKWPSVDRYFSLSFSKRLTLFQMASILTFFACECAIILIYHYFVFFWDIGTYDIRGRPRTSHPIWQPKNSLRYLLRTKWLMRGPSSSLNCRVAVMELYMFYCIYVYWNYVYWNCGLLWSFTWRKIDVFEFEFEFDYSDA